MIHAPFAPHKAASLWNKITLLDPTWWSKVSEVESHLQKPVLQTQIRGMRADLHMHAGGCWLFHTCIVDLCQTEPHIY